jgi:hypothetical protein
MSFSLYSHIYKTSDTRIVTFIILKGGTAVEKNSDMRARMDKKIAQELESFARLSDQFAAHPEVGQRSIKPARLW